MTTPRKTKPKPKPKVGDIVRVTWLDAWTDTSGEFEPHEWEDTCEVTTIGELARYGGGVVTVSPERVKGRFHRAATHIPAAIVERVEVLVAS